MIESSCYCHLQFLCKKDLQLNYSAVSSKYRSFSLYVDIVSTSAECDKHSNDEDEERVKKEKLLLQDVVCLLMWMIKMEILIYYMSFKLI